jgi:hypothetical protein
MKMEVTKENYEAFYLDYLENNLSVEDRKVFEKFLEKYPELTEPELTIVPCEEAYLGSISIETRTSIRIFCEDEVISEENIESFIIAYIENDLAKKKQKELFKYINRHSEFKNSLDLYKMTLLTPDYSVKYNRKNLLYKGKIRPLFYSVSAIAASLILAIMLVKFNPSKNPMYKSMTLGTSSNQSAYLSNKSDNQTADLSKKSGLSTQQLSISLETKPYYSSTNCYSKPEESIQVGNETQTPIEQVIPNAEIVNYEKELVDTTMNKVINKAMPTESKPLPKNRGIARTINIIQNFFPRNANKLFTFKIDYTNENHIGYYLSYGKFKLIKNTNPQILSCK